MPSKEEGNAVTTVPDVANSDPSTTHCVAYSVHSRHGVSNQPVVNRDYEIIY